MQLVFDFPITQKFSFENFVVCGGNETAFRLARMLAVDNSKNLLFIHGPSGSGKTHLLRAFAAELCLKSGRNSLPSLSFKEIEHIYGGDFPAEGLPRLAQYFLGEPALLIDDIHLMPDNPHVRSEFWQLFNDFHGSNRKIFITGAAAPREIPQLDEHLASRLLWGLVARVDISDDDSLRMIMKKLGEDRNILLPEDAVDYLMLHNRRELPPLIEALERLHRHSLETGRKISLRLARELFGY